ncbi:hypothetical protein CHARACLAT_009927 [Characodon lateralis]|uniref:Uncharacterized protein n=1 Tax=Characodon lateralis TaxID=208331 RepID=A0ABU7E3B8_9TELE|nr:hypothetical protein [Characodon lateralis]
MRTSASEVIQNQNSTTSTGQCFSNPSYPTVAQCNVVSTISSNLDGTLTLKSSTLKSRNGSEWRAFCNLNDIEVQQSEAQPQRGSRKDYIKSSMCNNSSCSLNSDNPYATIRDPPGLSCKHTESSYVEMKSPSHREVPFGGTATLLGTVSRNVYDVEPTVSILQGPNGMATGFSQGPYDLSCGSHIPSHYDILPVLKFQDGETTTTSLDLFGSLPVTLRKSERRRKCPTHQRLFAPFYFVMELTTQTAVWPLYGPPDAEWDCSKHC